MAGERDARRGLRILKYVGAGVLVLGCFVVGFAIPIGAIYIYLEVSGPSFDDREFEPALWTAHAGSWAEGNPRMEMADDLRDRLLEDRSTRERVVELLGEPDAPRRALPRSIAYLLGSWEYQAHVFIIQFGEDGRVERIVIGSLS